MKVTSATLVSIVGILGTLAMTLQGVPEPHLALAGTVLAAVYTLCHAFLNRPVAPVAAAPAPAMVTAIPVDSAPKA